MDRDRFDLWCERAIVAMALLTLVFGPLALGAVRTPEFLVLQVMTIGVGFLWLVRLWVNARVQLAWPGASWAVLIFVIYAIVRYRQADIEYVARQELIRIVVYAILFFAILNNFGRLESSRFFCLVLVALAAGLSVFAVFQFMTHNGKVWGVLKPDSYLSRGSGTYMNPNHLAGLLEMILPLALSCSLLSRLGHATRIVLGYLALVLALGLGVTGSRGGWISASVTLFFFFLVLVFQARFRVSAILMLILLLGVGSYFGLHYGRKAARVQESFAAGQLTDIRRDIWQVAWRMWQDHRLLGVGPGHFDYLFKEYRSPLFQLQDRPGYVHNDYLNTLVDWGLLGAALIALTWLIFYARIFAAWRRLSRSLGDSQSNTRAFLFGGACGVLAILIHSALDFNFQIPANAILAIALAAFASSQAASCLKQYRVPGILLKCLVSLLLVGGMFWLGVQAIKKTSEYAALQQTAASPQYSARALNSLETAFTVEPRNFETARAIGEQFRARSWGGGEDYELQAQSAMKWFKVAIALNSHDPKSFAQLGMCLDWLGHFSEADPYFDRANLLDPNGFEMLNTQGIHRVNHGDYRGAKAWFDRSLTLRGPWGNPQAMSYLGLINRKLAEKATASPL